AQLKIERSIEIENSKPLKFFSYLRWLDGKPLEIEPYRQRISGDVLYSFDPKRQPRFNLALMGRGKKNWKIGRPYLCCPVSAGNLAQCRWKSMLRLGQRSRSSQR